MPEYRSIPVVDLRLDLENPRHPPEPGQREVFAALLEDDSDKLLRLARDIVEHGLNPTEIALVLRQAPNVFVVLEGNRRVAALKLLSNPGLAGTGAIADQFKALAKKAGSGLPDEVRCFVVDTREEALHWLRLRHTGENEGAGVVRWSAEQAQRFSGRLGNHAGRGVIFADAVAAAYPKNKKLQANLADVRKNRLTTLGRLVSDLETRRKLGLEFQGGQLMTRVDVPGLETSVAKIVADLADKLTVSALKTRTQRQNYIDSLPGLPATSAFRANASPFVVAVGAPRRATGGRKKPSLPPVRLLTDLVFTNLSPRLSGILSELKQLDITRFPNASGVLLRVILELAVDELLIKKKRGRAQEFKDRLRAALRIVDPTDRDTQCRAPQKLDQFL